MKKYQLPKEFAEKWIAALRSGEYKQTIGNYKYGGCYCAVGLGYKSNGFYPDGTYVDLHGTKDHITGGLFQDVVAMNDKDKLSFSEIADWLTENVEFV